MPKSYLIDMDGVIVRGSGLIPGADAFLERLHRRNIKFLILTNNPLYTQRDLQHRLQRIGSLSQSIMFTRRRWPRRSS